MLSRYNILREISRKISNMISIIIYKIVNLIEGVSSSLKTKDKKFDEIKHRCNKSKLYNHTIYSFLNKTMYYFREFFFYMQRQSIYKWINLL